MGGFLVSSKGWRWTQWTILFFIVTFYIPVLFIRESYKKTILQRRAKSLNIQGPPSSQRGLVDATKYFLTTTIIRPIHMLFNEPIVALVCTYSAFQFGLMYTFVVASPYIFATVYHFNVQAQSLSFLGFMTGTILGPFPLILIDQLLYQPRLARFRQSHPPSSQFPPERRLYPSFPGAVLLPVSLLVFAWTTRPAVPWIVPVVFQALTVLSSLIIYAGVNVFMMDTYGPLYGASAAGANMMSRYTLSAVFPLFTLPMYKAMGVGWATSLLAFVALAMAPIPFVFWRWGGELRRRGKYETSA